MKTITTNKNTTCSHITQHIYQDIYSRIEKFFLPETPALSRRYPVLVPVILFVRRTKNIIQNFFNFELSTKKNTEKFKCVIARHQSVLRRTLGTSDMRLQEQKVTNLEIACEKLNNIVIEPQKIFSMWHILGNPSYKNGYVDGMLLSNGKVIEGVGGGLCQMSNFLCWIFLHTDIKIIERHHHSRDVFPDSGRTLPFGSGATNFYNLMDLKIKNTSSFPLQISITTTDKYLKGQILSPHNTQEKFNIIEKYHCFIRKNNQYFRYNQIWRQKKIQGKIISEEKIFTNFAPVLYEVTPEYLEKNGYNLVSL